MAYLSTADPRFRSHVRAWLTERGEVSALIQYHAAGGSKSFEFFTSMRAFLARLAELTPRTAVTVYGRQQLPLRGVVDEAFISKALSAVPDGAEFLIAGLELMSFGKRSWLDFMEGEGLGELRTELGGRVGKAVAVGIYPTQVGGVDEGVIWAIVPTPDGEVVAGIY